MRLTNDEALRRLGAHDQGVLSTVHPDRGVDAVPMVYAVLDGHVGVPVDRVKPKASTRLQRQRNLEADPRATLLIDHWDPVDWSRLWWVRAELRFEPSAPALADRLGNSLAERFPQYQDRSFADVIVLRIVGVTGWSGAQ
jgi:hypothetical protein